MFKELDYFFKIWADSLIVLNVKVSFCFILSDNTYAVHDILQRQHIDPSMGRL